MTRILTFLLLFAVLRSFAQQPLQGEIDYPQLGITFTVPEGWQANEGDGIVFIGSEQVSGLILLHIHDMIDMDELGTALEMGFSDDGIDLFSDGPARELREGIAIMDYKGQIEKEPAKGMGIGLMNPHGDGVIMVVLALEKVYGAQLENAATSIMESIVFREVPHDGPSVELWKRHLTNARLTRIEKELSPPSAENNGTAKGTSEYRIDLCREKFIIVDPARTLSPMAPDPHLEGAWDVVPGTKGKPVLRLDHKDGQRTEFQLDEQEGKIYLNGKRWFRTVGGEYAPDCGR